MPEVIHNADKTIEVKVSTAEDKEVDEKEYFSRFPGSNFYGTDGAVAVFDHAGSLRTTSFLMQRELDKVANKMGSPIYTGNKPVLAPNENAPSNDVQSRAAEVQRQLAARQAAGGS